MKLKNIEEKKLGYAFIKKKSDHKKSKNNTTSI